MEAKTRLRVEKFDNVPWHSCRYRLVARAFPRRLVRPRCAAYNEASDTPKKNAYKYKVQAVTSPPTAQRVDQYVLDDSASQRHKVTENLVFVRGLNFYAMPVRQDKVVENKCQTSSLC
jgi:hypothetical protein